MTEYRVPSLNAKVEVSKEEEYVDLKEFLKSTVKPEMGGKGGMGKTQKILEDIDQIINHSDEDFLKPNDEQGIVQAGTGQNLKGFDIFQNDFSASQRKELDQLEENLLNQNDESNESIYGIRTNINAVVEYCHLLIKYLLENYTEYLSQKFTFIRLCKETPDTLGLEINYEALKPFNSEDSPTAGLFNLQKENPKPDATKFNADKSKSEEATKTPNNSPENPDKNTPQKQKRQEDERLCWTRKTEKKMILTEQIYLALENQILATYENMNINVSLFNMQKIYHRCVFDSFNEIITAFIRQDLVFRLNPRDQCIMKLSVFSQDDVEYILAKTKSILVEYVQQQCGVLRDKEDSLLDSVLRTYDIIK